MSGNRHVVTRDAATEQITVPATPVAATDVASKGYVDTVATNATFSPTYTTGAGTTSVTGPSGDYYRVGNRVICSISANVVTSANPFIFDIDAVSLPFTLAGTPNIDGQISGTTGGPDSITGVFGFSGTTVRCTGAATLAVATYGNAVMMFSYTT
jgi:hypothetical protein